MLSYKLIFHMVLKVLVVVTISLFEHLTLLGKHSGTFK